jgi:hypothetical protein
MRISVESRWRVRPMSIATKQARQEVEKGTSLQKRMSRRGDHP